MKFFNWFTWFKRTGKTPVEQRTRVDPPWLSLKGRKFEDEDEEDEEDEYRPKQFTLYKGGRRTGRLCVIKKKKNTLTKQSRKRSTRRRSKQRHNPYRM